MKQILLGLVSLLLLAGCTTQDIPTASQPQNTSSVISEAPDSSLPSLPSADSSSEVLETQQAQETASSDDEDSSIPEATTELRITVGDTVLTAELDGSPLAQEIAAMLPQTFTMTRLQDREYYSPSLPQTPATHEEGQPYYQNGDLTYFAGANALAIFFDKADTDSVPQGIVIVGKVTSDFWFLVDSPGELEMQFALEP